MSAACCSPARASGAGEGAPTGASLPTGASGVAAETARLPGGDFLMGSEDAEGFPDDGEGPVRRVRLRPFAIDVAAVTNAQFEEFINASSYRTDA